MSTPVQHSERFHGAEANPAGVPDFLIEVPHGADTQALYDALFEQLKGPFPKHLERFFWVNTDVGAWSLGRQLAQALVTRFPGASVLCIRCLIPRTFIDVNRVIEPNAAPGMTPGLPSYVKNPADIALLRDLHARYTEHVAGAYEAICSAGGTALIPHTYAPRSVPIERVDHSIVKALEAVYQPGVIETAPLRAEVDLITATPEGEELAPDGLPEAIMTALSGIGLTAHRGGTYSLHPSTTGARWSAAYPGQVLCFEVRRDVVTDWEPFVPKRERAQAIQDIASAVAGAIKKNEPDPGSVDGLPHRLR